MRNQPDAVLFDLDGTLTDAGPGIINCVRYALDAMGIEHPDDATMRTFLGPPLYVTFGEHFNMSEPDVTTAIDLYRERYHDVGMFENEVFEGIPDVLAGLQAHGVRMAIATSKPDYSATRILEHFDLADYFEFIGADDLHGSRSSKEAVIKYVLDNTQLDPNIHSISMVGDRRHNVEGARAHGIPTVGVLWGYGDHAELDGAGASQIVSTPMELAEALRA